MQDKKDTEDKKITNLDWLLEVIPFCKDYKIPERLVFEFIHLMQKEKGEKSG